MSELITNLNAIYNTKLQIKAALNTDSDNFSDYPSYISGMVSPSGTSYITTNGDYDIASYAYVNVDVQGGGCVDYQLVDLSYTMTVGEKYEFNGLLGINGQITSEIAQTYPVFEPYIGSYLCGIVGNDNTTSDYYSKGCIFENEPVSLSQKGVVARGTFLGTYDIAGNTDLVVVDDCIEAKYAGGNGTKNITSNGTQQVAGYQSVSVNVSNHDGLTEATAFTVDEAIAFINTLNPNTPTSDMFYVKGRISQVIYTIDSRYNTWRGYISDDGVMYNDQTASDNVDHSKELFIYNNGYDVNYQTVNWNVGLNPQVKVGDSVVIYANFQLWTDTKISRKPQTNNGYLANHQRAVNGSPVNPITTNSVVDVQDYVSVSVNVPDSEFNQSKLTDNPDDSSYAYLRITNTNTQNTIYYQLYPLDGTPICTTIVRLHDIIDYCFPNISYDNLIINLVYWNNTVYYNDTVGGALFESNFVSPLLLQIGGTSTDSFITNFIPDHLCIGINLTTNQIYIWNGDSVFQDGSSQSM